MVGAVTFKVGYSTVKHLKERIILQATLKRDDESCRWCNVSYALFISNEGIRKGNPPLLTLCATHLQQAERDGYVIC